MGAMQKVWISLVLVALAGLEFYTAMHVYGVKGQKRHVKLMLRIHRVGGYVFGAWFLWVMWIGVTLLGKLSDPMADWHMDARVFFHAGMAVLVFLLLLLKISFIRAYTNFRSHARMLGFLLVLGTILIWIISGGFWLIILGGMKYA